jgi:hypothetical protein
MFRDSTVRTYAVQDNVRAQVGGQNDDGVLEVHRPAVAVRNASVVQHLQKHVENVGMAFSTSSNSTTE